jgi:hypothetical protein
MQTVTMRVVLRRLLRLLLALQREHRVSQTRWRVLRLRDAAELRLQQLVPVQIVRIRKSNSSNTWPRKARTCT